MKGIKPETFIHAMEEEGIYLSTKSACSTSSLSNAIYSIYHDEISNREPVKGDVGINNKVVNDGNNATIYSGDYETDEALVTKTVTKLDAENGIYNVELRVKGKNKEDSTTVTKPVYVVVVFDTSGSMICDSDKMDILTYLKIIGMFITLLLMVQKLLVEVIIIEAKSLML